MQMISGFQLMTCLCLSVSIWQRDVLLVNHGCARREVALTRSSSACRLPYTQVFKGIVQYFGSNMKRSTSLSYLSFKYKAATSLA